MVALLFVFIIVIIIIIIILKPKHQKQNMRQNKTSVPHTDQAVNICNHGMTVEWNAG